MHLAMNPATFLWIPLLASAVESLQKKNAWLFQRKSARTLSNGGNNRNALCSLSPCRVGGHLQSAPSLQPPTPPPPPKYILKYITPRCWTPSRQFNVHRWSKAMVAHTRLICWVYMVGGWLVIWVSNALAAAAAGWWWAPGFMTSPSSPHSLPMLTLLVRSCSTGHIAVPSPLLPDYHTVWHLLPHILSSLLGKCWF